MLFSIQTPLENDKVGLYPLQETDFASLFALASDPKVWEQHPNKDRWKEAVFRVFFDGAMQSKGAYKIVDKTTGEVAGCTRFYDYDEKENTILIGYTFYAVPFWGTGINPSVKRLMMDYAFQFVDAIDFHIGATNYRSQIAISRLGVTKIAEENIAYHGETPKLNFIYRIRKQDWETIEKI
ncbi:GNAT family N-acetyltransferase [Flavobacterium supellecticarium]|uniref:GNAT family N-acetyltransferase n=1 Tax=Flavobacterium supellecticarium TaxID=2565924 RepID=A0A4S4A0E3_9FLAO|nr:GNAT family N-acetyltransferase [Flavobacterium supellecticarium]THF51718.1 GNAT family N-acetyltransferase [Flavobacterium supellecticarium]